MKGLVFLIFAELIIFTVNSFAADVSTVRSNALRGKVRSETLNSPVMPADPLDKTSRDFHKIEPANSSAGSEKTQPPDPWDKTLRSSNAAVSANSSAGSEKAQPPDPWGKTAEPPDPWDNAAVSANSSAGSKKFEPPDPWGKTAEPPDPWGKTGVSSKSGTAIKNNPDKSSAAGIYQEHKNKGIPSSAVKAYGW